MIPWYGQFSFHGGSENNTLCLVFECEIALYEQNSSLFIINVSLDLSNDASNDNNYDAHDYRKG